MTLVGRTLNIDDVEHEDRMIRLAAKRQLETGRPIGLSEIARQALDIGLTEMERDNGKDASDGHTADA